MCLHMLLAFFSFFNDHHRLHHQIASDLIDLLCMYIDPILRNLWRRLRPQLLPSSHTDARAFPPASSARAFSARNGQGQDHKAPEVA